MELELGLEVSYNENCWLHSRIHLCLHHTERAEQPPSKIRMSPRGRAARYRRNFGTRRYQSQLPCYPLDWDSSRTGMGYLPLDDMYR